MALKIPAVCNYILLVKRKIYLLESKQIIIRPNVLWNYFEGVLPF